MYILAQIIGALAIFCWVISIQNKKKDNVLICQLIANFLYAIQYFLLNVSSAALMNVVSVVRSLVFYDNETHHKQNPKYILIFFITIILLIGVLTFNGLLSLIPILITIAYTYSVWQNNLNITRFVFLIAAFIWIYYNFQVGAYIAVFGNIIEIISGIISIIRFRRS